MIFKDDFFINFLNKKANFYNNLQFIDTDPIQIPHLFTIKEDIEIAAFLTATIAWGNRKSIITNAKKILGLLDNSPYDFIKNHTPKDIKNWNHVIHRTFNANDLKYFCLSLQYIYSKGKFEHCFILKDNETNYFGAINRFREQFFSIKHEKRTEKHISKPNKNSACKRINLFLRWMIRQDSKGVDFGIWKGLSPKYLSCPLDIHSGNVARKLGILTRLQNDRKAVEELDINLRLLNPEDPVIYDFALFGLGAFENYKL